jgi:hypothetical protein
MITSKKNQMSGLVVLGTESDNMVLILSLLVVVDKETEKLLIIHGKQPKRDRSFNMDDNKRRNNTLAVIID